MHLLRSLPRHARRLGMLRAVLLVSGIGLLLSSSAAPLAGGRDAAATLNSLRAEPHTEDESMLDVGPALARVDADALYGGLARLLAALHPTPTPTSTPTPTPAAAPLPEQPAAPPRQVSARQGRPAAPPAPTPTPQAPASPSCPTASMSGFALALFNAINNERTQRGLPSLATHGCVVYIAQLRSDDMASRGYFSHTSPEGETASSLMDQYGVPYGWAGENLARNNYPDDQSVGVAIRDLMASEGHREIVLSGNYTHLGVGAADDGAGMKYYTMVFIGPR